MATVSLEQTTGRQRALVTYAPIAGVAVTALLMLVLWAGWRLTAKQVRVAVDGRAEVVETHRTTVADLLLDLNIAPGTHDRIIPPPGSRIVRDMQLTIDRARPLRVLADGRDYLASSWGETPVQALADAGVTIERYDQVLIDSVPAAQDARLPPRAIEEAAPTYDRGFAWDAVHTEPLQVRVYRSIPVVVHEGGLPYTIDSTAQTVGEALRQAEVVLYLGDRVQPSLGSRITANMHIYIERSVPVALRVDGRQIKTRTQAKTVGDALSDIGIAVTGADRVEPPLATALYDNIKIAITRVSEEVVVEEEIAPYETVFVGDPNLPIDTQQVLDPGANGITRTRYRVRYEDGAEAARVREDRWVAQEPAERRIAYGQSVTPQTATVDGQTITYWRKMKAYATSYHPAAVGNNRTRTGDIVRKGVVAVDPRIIPLQSPLFVPGYGQGKALDTGGGIISRRIDLGYEDDTYVSTSKWVDVYLLWPPPPEYQIAWVLPNYPPVPE